MSTILPINVRNLLRHRSVESERVEFKASWDEATTGPQVLRTICAFANDYHNLNGGYVVVGVEEHDGRAILPPCGLSFDEADAAQRWIRGQCNRLDPPYPPVLSPEEVDGKLVLVVWAPASEMRPHRAPARDNARRYWVRLGAETVDAEQRGDLIRGLLQQTAKVPWDDRRAHDARIEDLREGKVREYLHDVDSGLVDEEDKRDIYRRLRLTARVNDHEVPRNIGLLLFADQPERWIRGAHIEVVQFAADRAGAVQEERTFRGPLVDQLANCLNYLDSLTTHHLQKQRDQYRVRGWTSYPAAALRETVVNAVYHRGYDVDQPEPTKVYLFPSRAEVISYPGPVPGIEPQHFLPGARPHPVPARNRRIGEFLKELGFAEGRLSGLPKIFEAMQANGSPVPTFAFDEQRTFFQATLPAHPEYAALSALRDASHLRAVGENGEALRRVESAWEAHRDSAALAGEVIRLHAAIGDTEAAEAVFDRFAREGRASAQAHVRNVLIDALMDAGEYRKARLLLDRHPPRDLSGQDAIDAAILARRGRQSRLAHRYFVRAGEVVQEDPRALLEFAQTKIRLASEEADPAGNRRLLTDAREQLERVVRMDTSATRRAWAWRELARTLDRLRLPRRDVERAYGRAIELLPSESRFAEELARVRARRAV